MNRLGWLVLAAGIAAMIAVIVTIGIPEIPRRAGRPTEPARVAPVDPRADDPPEAAGASPATRDSEGEEVLALRADTVVAYVDGAPLTGVDLNPALATGDTLPIRRDVLGAMVERTVERSLASQEAVRLGLSERPEVMTVLGFVDESIAGDPDMPESERQAYAVFLRQQRLEMFWLRSVGAHDEAVLDDWFERLVAGDRERYAAIADSAPGEEAAREAVRDAVSRDFAGDIDEEVSRRRNEALTALRRAVRIVVVEPGA